MMWTKTIDLPNSEIAPYSEVYSERFGGGSQSSFSLHHESLMVWFIKILSFRIPF